MISARKGFALVVVVIIIAVVIGVVAIFGYQKYAINNQGLVNDEVPVTADEIKSTSSPLTQISDETLNWKTYTNNYYHFSIKYPNNWETHSLNTNAKDEPQDRVSFHYFREIGKVNDRVEIDIENGLPGALQSQVDRIKGFTWLNLTIEKQKIDSVDTTKFTGVLDGHKATFAVFYANGYYFTLSSIDKDDNTATVLNQMLSTFKFTN